VRSRLWILQATDPVLVSKATRFMLPLSNWHVRSRGRGLSSMPGQGNRVVGQATPGDTEYTHWEVNRGKEMEPTRLELPYNKEYPVEALSMHVAP
jgi:hypothetical protein